MTLPEAGGAPLVPLSRIRGHRRTCEVLSRALETRCLYPSLIFHGPEGVGRRTTALAVAAALVCRDPRGTDGCGSCLACRRVLQAAEATHRRDGIERRETVLHYPDVGYITLARTDSGRQRTRILVSQVRDLIHSMAQRPFELTHRIYILDPADSLSVEAQNALLKVLEEPPPFGVVILVATSLGSLLPTIRSRCQSFPFAPLPETELHRLLRSEGRDEATAAALATLADGRVGRALGLDLEELRETRGALLDALETVVRSTESAGAVVKEVQDLLEGGVEAPAALQVLGELARDLMVLEESGPTASLVHGEVKERLGTLAASRPDAAQRVGRLEILRGNLASVNLNSRMALEAALLIWAEA